MFRPFSRFFDLVENAVGKIARPDSGKLSTHPVVDNTAESLIDFYISRLTMKEDSEAFEDARFVLRNHLNTIEELNTRSYQMVRLNAVILTIISAVTYNSKPSIYTIGVVTSGAIALIVVSVVCFRLMSTSPVGVGMNPSSLREYANEEITEREYFDHAIGTIYPKAIENAQRHDKRHSKWMNRLYLIEGVVIVWITLGTVATIGTLGG